MLILDSATYSVPNDIVKKALWRIVNGRMIFAPIASAFSNKEQSGLLLSSGFITESEDVSATVSSVL